MTETQTETVTIVISHNGSPAQSGYAEVWEEYHAAGWVPLPLPTFQKFPPPKGYTGDDAKQPRPRQYRRWAENYPDGNVCIVMPEGVVGIDVDAYHGGDRTLRQLCRRYGNLPDAPKSTSRDDGSGISFYRVLAGTRLQGKAGRGIEIIQPHHRYAVVWPSLHPETGDQYRWSDDEIPCVSSLPDLPDSWTSGLAARTSGQGSGTSYDGDVSDWLESPPEGRLPLRVRLRVRDAEREFRFQGGRYDAMVNAVAYLVHCGAKGQPVNDALIELHEAYCYAVSGERDGDSEFWRALDGAIHKFGNDNNQEK